MRSFCSSVARRTIETTPTGFPQVEHDSNADGGAKKDRAAEYSQGCEKPRDRALRHRGDEHHDERPSSKHAILP